MFSVLFFSGVLLISLALCADAVIGNVQEKAMKMHRASSAEVVSMNEKTLIFFPVTQIGAKFYFQLSPLKNGLISHVISELQNITNFRNRI